MATDITKDPRVTATIARIKSILLTPATEWDKIEGEPADIQKLFLNYVLILAAIPAVCTFLHFLLFSPAPTVSIGNITVGYSAGHFLGWAVVAYITSVLMAGIIGLAAEFLAPHFGGKQDRGQAFKLAVYSLTAMWVAGVLALLKPVLATLVGLYSFYLFYLGAPKLMKVAKDKAVIYTAIVTVVSLVVNAIVMTIMR
ncbi:MAG: Yip1 family protein [Alphaproteobacteria bacterium]